jgi:hypothetical protein
MSDKYDRTELDSKLDLVSSIKEYFSEYFGVEIYSGFDDMRHVVCWEIIGNSIHWNVEDDVEDDVIEEDGYCYSFEFSYDSSVWEKEEFVLVEYDDSCGNDVLAIFDNKTRNNG